MRLGEVLHGVVEAPVQDGPARHLLRQSRPATDRKYETEIWTADIDFIKIRVANLLPYHHERIQHFSIVLL